jgi:hypothetical protein
MKVVTSADLELNTSLHPGIVYFRLGAHYCKPMHLLDQCTLRCQNCKAYIENILNRTEKSVDLRDPYDF